MKITDVIPILLSAERKCERCPSVTRSASLIKVKTDSGLTGIGEAYAGLFIPELIPKITEMFKPILVGEDPFNINMIWQKLHVRLLRWGRTGFPVSVISGIECALWDIVGKALELPVYRLLGGLTRHKMPIYLSVGGLCSTWPLEKTIENLRSLIQEEKDMKAFKIATGYLGKDQRLSIKFIREEEEKVSSIREVIGPDIELMVDHHAGADVPSFSRQEMRRIVELVRVLEPYFLLFFEEPVPPTDLDQYAKIRVTTRVPIAGGENAKTLEEFKQYLSKGAIDIAQPDVTWIGGIIQCLKAIAAAEAYDIPVALHAAGTGASILANLHVALASPNVFILEYPSRSSISDPLIEGLYKEPLVIEEGYISPPQALGLGTELSEEFIRQHPYQPDTGQAGRRMDLILCNYGLTPD